MNQLLQKMQDAVLQKADPRLVPVINKVVDAGKKIMYSQQTRAMFIQEIKRGTDPEQIGSAVAKLVGILYNQSHKSIPPEVLVKAATVLLCEGLQFLEDAGQVKVTPAFLAACTKAMASAVLQLVGATPEQVGSILSGQQQSAQGQAPAGQPVQTTPTQSTPVAAPATPPTAQPAGIIQGAR